MNEIKDEKRFLQILKKEKEYGQGSIFYIAGIITWVLGIIVSCIRYLGEMGEMTSEDITYLKRISIPRMVIKKVRANGETLTFETSLEPNEIQFIHVSRIY